MHETHSDIRVRFLVEADEKKGKAGKYIVFNSSERKLVVMKKMERDVFVGWVVVLLVILVHVLITVSLGNSYFAESSLNRMLWFSSFPAFLITFVAAFFLKTNTMMLAIRRGLLWTIELMVAFTLLAWLFRSFEGLYASAGLYWLFGAVLIGPIFYVMAFRRQHTKRIRTP